MTETKKQNGGKRPGAGRKPTPTPNKTPWGTKVSPVDLDTLRGYPQARAAELLASGLRLGAGNVGVLNEREEALIRAAMAGTYMDALAVRVLAEEVQAIAEEAPDAAVLARRMREWSDWELLHVVLRLA